MREHCQVRRCVAFDLDMTLVDTRPGIATALAALAEETGQPIDIEGIVSCLGPPVAEVLTPWFAGQALNDAVDAFRGHMARVGVVDVAALPGAEAAVAATRDAGLGVMVVTAKIERLAVATLSNAGLEVDEVFGNHWAQAKAEPLRTRDAVCFVGDHPADMKAAASVGVAGFGVTSGASTSDELIAAGASYVAESLLEFPKWLEAHLAAGL